MATTETKRRPMATKTKLSVNLSEEATEVVRELATRRGSSVSDVLREAIALYKFILDERQRGGDFTLTHDAGHTHERVHFVFAP